MFYRLPDPLDSQNVLVETAHIISAGPEPLSETDLGLFLEVCFTERPNVHELLLSGQTQFQGVEWETQPSDMAGLVALLEFIIVSDGNSKDALVPSAIDIFAAFIAQAEGVDTPEDAQRWQTFTRDVVTRLLTIASRFASLRARIHNSLWELLIGLSNTLSATTLPAQSAAATSLAAGFLSAFSDSEQLQNHDHFEEIGLLFNNLQRIGLCHYSVSSEAKTPGSSSSYSHIDDAVNLLCQLFQWINQVLARLLVVSSESDPGVRDVWDALMTNIAPTAIINSAILDVVNSVLATFRDPMWLANIGEVINEVDSPQSEHLFPVIVDVLVIGAVLVPGHESQTLDIILDQLARFETIGGQHLDIYLAAIEGLGILYCHFPGLREDVLKLLSDFLIGPSPVFISMNSPELCDVLRRCTSTVFYQCLKLTSSSAVSSTCLSVFNGALHMSSADSGPSAEVRQIKIQNIVAALTSIAPLLKPVNIIEIIAALIQRLDNASASDGFLWESLGNLGLTCNIDIFREVVNCLLKEKGNFKRIARVGQTLARVQGKSSEYFETYIETVFSIFIEKSKTLVGKSEPSVVYELRNLAHIIRAIFDHDEFDASCLNNAKLSAVTRDFWIQVSILFTLPSGQLQPDWSTDLTHIAAKSPALTLDKSKNSLEADLVANSILGSSYGDDTAQKVRLNLAGTLSVPTTELRALPFVCCAYLHTVRQLELLRVSKKPFKEMLSYLTDERLHNSGVIYDHLESIASEVVRTLCADPRPSLCASQRHRNMVLSSQTLVAHAVHRSGRVRQFAIRSLQKMWKAAPSLLWNYPCAALSLDILRICNQAHSVAATSSDIAARTGLDFEFADDDERRAAVQEFQHLCNKWLSISSEKSLSETVGVLEHYLLDTLLGVPSASITSAKGFSALLGGLHLNSDLLKELLKRQTNGSFFTGEVRGMVSMLAHINEMSRISHPQTELQQVAELCKASLGEIAIEPTGPETYAKLRPALYRAAAAIVLAKEHEIDHELLQRICWVPIVHFAPSAISLAVEVWGWILCIHPQLSVRILGDLVSSWGETVQKRQGLYAAEPSPLNPFFNKMTYAPSVPPEQTEKEHAAHLVWVQFLIDRFQVVRHSNRKLLYPFLKLIQLVDTSLEFASPKPELRPLWFLISKLGLLVVQELEKQRSSLLPSVRRSVYNWMLSWFAHPPMWSVTDENERETLESIMFIMRSVRIDRDAEVAQSTRFKSLKIAAGVGVFSPKELLEINEVHQLLLMLLESELTRLRVWKSTQEDSTPLAAPTIIKWSRMIRAALGVAPSIILYLQQRFITSSDVIDHEIRETCFHHLRLFVNNSDALPWILPAMKKRADSWKWLLYWAPVSPVSAIGLLTKDAQNTHIIQYGIRVLKHFPIDQVFFYIPQLVQALRHDTYGYIEKYILGAAKLKQLFAHQIIWNMKANQFRDFSKEGEGITEDPLKPTLEKITDKIVKSLSGADEDFYKREFSFFGEVTGISGKLKPYIHKSKPEKKKKIDEEMRKIVVDVGVYLPSNPESVVVDIDYDSGRPLQSHAKAPFMATFQIKPMVDSTDLSSSREQIMASNAPAMRQSAIFKVGDDCRQDILALQLISVFKSIFAKVDLDLYVFPYRVVATAPGSGVIEVVPNSISRDIMGRETVNSLVDYFVSKFGPQDSAGFAKARSNFVRSLAPYSLILFLLQIKDRHNGNILFDADGHIVHIDFGFIIDISPGGVNFENSPFKLTTEMIAVMGGDATTPSYKLLSDQIIKAYLACRPHAEEIIALVSSMLESGLPCFKGENSIKKLRDRFQLHLTERQAADFMLSRIRESHENTMSKIYDGFQNWQNGIPY
ncbi:uncharacterized protein BJ171DRAFT_499012 [Polychytrium aggregatum]|uniref:uncharacterized protein n=1 Tax=Polychytrium aggregatum TaxID=110093 RepID=UPI0022FED931|nr:uncharacterized protein BJ171DRAFT_499012 [Polychytrium aggregatum]KAI9206169.1 hypothetical protein BJ171DRAFT_499012 [Polychytrium aggregatum]